MKKYSPIQIATDRIVPMWSAFIIIFLVISGLIDTRHAVAQTEDNPPYVESTGLIVMQTESVPRPVNWAFENTEEGHTGAGYLRYTGTNHFNEPGIDIMEYNIVIEHPGVYRLFVFLSHIGAPEPDQHNDVWTKMDDGDWFKTVHGSEHVDKGFSYHTTWVVPNPGGGEDFLTPEYDLEAGAHTLFVSGRSWNARIDRIHIWKFEPPFQVPFNEATDNSHPETERDGKVLTALPTQVSFPATQVGESSVPIAVTFTNGGTEDITIGNVSLSGIHPDAFGHNFSGSLTVPAGGSNSLNVTFSPNTQGFKTAKLTFDHDGLNAPTAIDLFGTATSGGTGTTVLFRANAGGPLIVDGAGNWEEDQTADETHANGAAEAGTPHPFVNAAPIGDWTFGRDDVVTLDNSVPPGTPMEIFQRGRWDPGSSPNQQWDIPIDAGKEIEVRLYFAEQFFIGPDDPPEQGWPRLFDAEIDGIVYPQLDDINIFESVGHDVGMMRSVVIISDGIVDVNLNNISHDPIVQAIEIVEVGGVSKAFNPGWNLVGLPTSPADNNYASAFSDVSPLGAPFIWNGSGYVPDGTMENGKGYWMEVEEGGSQSFEDAGVTSLSIPVVAGWNLISGPICLVPFTNISDPGSVLVEGTLYTYNGGYQQSSALLPGSGYWVQADEAGTISMTCDAAGKTGPSFANLPNVDSFGKIQIRDAGNGFQQLYFGGSLEQPEDRKQFKLPPRAHDGLFDVRFAENSRLHEGDEQIVHIQSRAFPIELDFQNLPQEIYEIKIEEFANSDLLRAFTVSVDEKVAIQDDRVTALRITTESFEAKSLPKTFTLQGNYPNPFNPTTHIVFDMPESGVVHLDVYDLMGRRLMSLPGREVAAGAARQIKIDASQLASGTYMYQIRVDLGPESIVRTGRMILLK